MQLVAPVETAWKKKHIYVFGQQTEKLLAKETLIIYILLKEDSSLHLKQYNFQNIHFHLHIQTKGNLHRYTSRNDRRNSASNQGK